MSFDEIRESHQQFLDAWRLIARHARSGEVLDLPEVHIAAANVA